MFFSAVVLAPEGFDEHRIHAFRGYLVVKIQQSNPEIRRFGLGQFDEPWDFKAET
jgi:hypothetical protein